MQSGRRWSARTAPALHRYLEKKRVALKPVSNQMLRQPFNGFLDLD